jgi:hypothetical protein
MSLYFLPYTMPWILNVIRKSETGSYVPTLGENTLKSNTTNTKIASLNHQLIGNHQFGKLATYNLL